jgi:hypothetical protein
MVYEGDFKSDKVEGQGILYYGPDLPCYEGWWKDGMFEGFGCLINDKLTSSTRGFAFEDFGKLERGWLKFQGEFSKGLKNGRGIIYLTNGEIFIGNFKDGKVEGEGMFIKVNAEKIKGLWRGNVLEKGSTVMIPSSRNELNV